MKNERSTSKSPRPWLGHRTVIGIDLGPATSKRIARPHDPTDTARVLVQALPYIRRFAGKAVVVKLGGAAIDKELDQALAQDVLCCAASACAASSSMAAGPQVDAMMRRVGKEPEFRDGLRVTDAETLEIVRMVLVGKINRDLVATINREALEEPVAVGVSGEDAGLLTVTPRTPASASSATFPTFAPPCFTASRRGARAGRLHDRRRRDRPAYNINADEAARASPRRWAPKRSSI
jgi:acetylglutamate kinase